MQRVKLAHTDGSRYQFKRELAPVGFRRSSTRKHVLPGMQAAICACRCRRGLTRRLIFIRPISMMDYRWCMVVDLDRCIGCGACVVACYAENNVAGGRPGTGDPRARDVLAPHRALLRLERPRRRSSSPCSASTATSAPCESVCPVYAPHHSRRGPEQSDLQSLHRHALLLAELPLQSAPVQLVHLRLARAAELAAQSRCDRAAEGA